jgi:hypothetical protein
MVEAAKDRMCNNISEPLDRACARRVLPERNVNSRFIIIGAVFRKNSPKVLFAEHDQMISTLPPKTQWEFPQLCRGGSKSLTFQEVESTGSSMKL